MKKKVINTLIILGITLGIILGTVLSNSTYAGTGKLYTNLASVDSSGIGYGIGDPNNKGKYIWHMSTYDSIKGGLSEKQKNIYCLKGDYGASWEDFYTVSPILEYNMYFDMQEERQELLNKIVDNQNDADEIIQELLDINGNQYREILWLLDNMYIKGENNKEDYLAKAGIAKDEYEGVIEYYNVNTGKIYGEEVLTEEDIIALQRVAIWTFTNGGDFDKTENQNWLNITTDNINYDILSDSRNSMAEDVYNYLVSTAKKGADLYTAENNYTINEPPVEINTENLTQENGRYKINTKVKDSNYIIGPIKIDQNNDFLYKISMTLTNEKGAEINSNQYEFTDQNGISLGNNITLKELVGKEEGFYIKLDKNLATKINIQVQIVHYNTIKNLWLQGTEDSEQIKLNAEQPIAEFSREEKTTVFEGIAETEMIEVTVTKAWDDNNNQDGIRPNSINVNLKKDDTIVEKATLNDSNNWTHTFKDLPANENGVKVNYTVEEVGTLPNYISTTTGDIETGYIITNKHVPETISLPVTKIWEDENNQDGIRPNSITVELLKNGETYSNIELNNTNEWKHTFENLPKYENGIEINYTVKESGIPTQYISKTTGDMETGYVITNTHVPATIGVAVEKIWEDGNNQDGIRPNSITVDLLKNGEKYSNIELNNTNEWKHTFENLPKYENGVEINYTVEESGIPTQYISKIIGDMKTGYVITNTYTTEKIDISVTKIWEDENNQDGIRPNSITVDLLKNGEKYSNIELNNTNKWKHTFENLPKYENGEEISYTVEESGIPAQYMSETTGDMRIGYVITNTYIPGTTSLKVKKVWEDGNNQDGIRPNSITVELLKNGETYKSAELNDSNNWQYIFTNLPEKENNETIEYSVKEITQIEGYTTKIETNSAQEYIITNTHIPKKTFDLALRKYITKINDNEITTLGLGTRVPKIDTKTIETEKTATYNHRKDPIAVEENDIITYTITIYNEGQKKGYATQIIDQLPEGLIYTPSATIVSKDAKGIEKNTYKVTYESSTNRIIFDIVNTTDKPSKELAPYENENLDSETIEIKCKVVHRAKTGSSNILTNVAWINEAYNIEDDKIITTQIGEDIDSEPANAPKVSKNNMENYKGNDNNPSQLSDSTYFYKGQQDDDDFEKIRVKIFDLSLRKFITLVNNEKLENSREPKVNVNPLQKGTGTTAIYNHSKVPLGLKVGDKIIYTIRIYNEGEIDGFASEVTDYLPSYLKFVKNSTINSKYKWNISEDGRIATTTYLEDKEISAFDKTKLDYEDLQIECEIAQNAVINEKITNIAEITEYKYGDKIYKEDIDSKSDNMVKNLPEDKDLPEYKKEEEKNEYVPGNEDDDDFEKVYVKKFDLALRKFITQVQNKEITTRVPQVKNENGKISYEHSKEPLVVHVGDVIIYTLRIYNEGEIDGYANEITDDIPEYLEYLPKDSTNVEYMWKMYDENGKETQEVENAVKLKTTYLSKENSNNNLLVAFDGNTIYYRDIKIAFKVKDPDSNSYIITNHAQISDDRDETNKPIKDKDSEPDIWNEGEDDQDIENVKVEYFDLSILKFVSKVIIQENETEKITETGYNGLESPEPIVKVELHKKKLKDVVVKFGYGITITNEGDIPGYAKEITDYIPEGLKFEQKDNPEWKDEGNNVISTRQLENILLQPGESKTIEVVLTWINSPDNMALKTNTVEISKDKNNYDVPDKDSTPDNKKENEDDIDIANVMLVISTGSTKTYFSLTMGLLTVVAIGIFLIKKYVL